LNRNDIRALFVATYPESNASTRHRATQYFSYLSRHGVSCCLRPFLSERGLRLLYRRGREGELALSMGAGAVRRAVDLLGLRRFDVVFVQREAALIGPPLFEALASRLYGKPLVWDMDDDLFVYAQGAAHPAAKALLVHRRKAQSLAALSSHIIVGNTYLKARLARFRKAVTVIPTVVDADRFVPARACRRRRPVLGWMGSHSTAPWLHGLRDVLRRLQQRFRFSLVIVGAGRFRLDGVEAEYRPWRYSREVDDLQGFDVGLYPLDEMNRCTPGKCGLKAIAYMAVGVPCVATPVGMVEDIVAHGTTGYLARSAAEWEAALERLLIDEQHRREMGRAGRAAVEQRFSLRRHQPRMLEVLRRAARQG